MSYLLQVANQRPMLRVAAEVVVVFCFAAPLVLAFSSVVAYGALAHTLNDDRRDVQHAFSIPTVL